MPPCLADYEDLSSKPSCLIHKFRNKQRVELRKAARNSLTTLSIYSLEIYIYSSMHDTLADDLGD